MPGLSISKGSMQLLADGMRERARAQREREEQIRQEGYRQGFEAGLQEAQALAEMVLGGTYDEALAELLSALGKEAA